MPHASLLEFEGLDVDALKALLISERSSHAAEIKRQRNSHTGEIERLRLLIEKLRRMLFGTKSEKMLQQID